MRISLYNWLGNTLILGQLAVFLLVCFLSVPLAQNKRCDLTVKVTPGDTAVQACLDLKALQNGGQAIQTASNATRISSDGFKICKNVGDVLVPEGADIVFVYDNSGSMEANTGWIDIAEQDTLFYWSDQGCLDTREMGTITYQLHTGIMRTIPRLANGNGCNAFAGDPYSARGIVMKLAIDYINTNAPGSTAGAMAFTNGTQNEQPLLPMNLPANVARLKNSILLTPNGGTEYRPPLLLSYRWLDDTTLTRVRKPAIIFISDGAPSDTYLDILRKNIPIYSIFLGYPTADYRALQTMSVNSAGTFKRVNPKNVAEINTVMRDILRSIIKPTLPLSMIFTNTSLIPPQVSRSTSITVNPIDGNLNIVLDNFLTLQAGTNLFTVQITVSPNDIRNYKFTVNTTGNQVGVSDSTLICYDQPKLVLINQNTGIEDPSYPIGTTNYFTQLTREGTDLSTITVPAISRDVANPSWVGDQETSDLSLLSTTGNVTVFRGPQIVNSSPNSIPTRMNGILESISKTSGQLVLNWFHPRDPREFASYTLPGRNVTVIKPDSLITHIGTIIIPPMKVIQPFGWIEIVKPFTLGTNQNNVNIKSGLIIGGLNWDRQTQDSIKITNSVCLKNCGVTINPHNTISFLFKIPPAPFSYSVTIFDHLGQFVFSEKGRIESDAIKKIKLEGDTAGVIFQVPPVANSGQLFGTGVYIVKINLQTDDKVLFKNKAGVDVLLSASRVNKVWKAGFIRKGT